MEADGVRRLLHLDVFIIVINIDGIPTQNQHINVVIMRNVYAKQKHVANAQSIHIVKVLTIQHVQNVHTINHIQL